MGIIGQKIKKLRFKAKKTQGDIAVVLGISVPAFSKIEAEITDVNTARIMQLAKLFKVHPSWFFLEEEEEDRINMELRALERDLLKEKIVVKELQEKLIRAMEENNDLMKTFMKF